MIGSETNVVLDKKLTAEEGENITKQISKVKGVFTAHFNAKAKTVYVHYTGLEQVCEDIKKIEGVKGFNHDGLHYRQ